MRDVGGGDGPISFGGGGLECMVMNVLPAEGVSNDKPWGFRGAIVKFKLDIKGGEFRGHPDQFGVVIFVAGI